MITQEQFDALCRQKLSVFTARALKEIEPSSQYVHNWHLDCVSEYLQAVWDKDIKRLIINVPPRSLKTHMGSISFPAWGFGQDPTIKFMITSFKSDLSKQMTRKTRILLNSQWYKNLYPNISLAHDQNQVQHFELESRGQYYSSAMSSVTGTGADIQICDDPLAPDEAASPAQRQNCIDTIRSTLFSRFNDLQNGRFVLIMQRLNDDDPTGCLLKDDGWEHLKLPVEAIGKTYSYSARGKTWELKEGDLLFPERFSREVLTQKAREMGAYNYAGQMLQEPTPIGGGEFRLDYINYFSSKTFKAQSCNLYILVDPAKGTEDAIKNDNDYTAMVVYALSTDNNYYIIDGVRERLNPTERVNKLFELHRKWNALTSKSPKVGYEDIGLHGDLHYIEKKQIEESYRFSITALPQKGEKRIKKIPKIRRLLPLFETGRIWLPNDIYYKDAKSLPRNFMSDIVEQEMVTFPFAPHDDFLDAMSMIFDINPVFPKIQTNGYIDSFRNHDIDVLDM